MPKILSDRVLPFFVNSKIDKKEERKIPIVKIVFISFTNVILKSPKKTTTEKGQTKLQSYLHQILILF
ncbi:hypothetical protein CCYN2B_40190 [Capnocytophaga cynodegmi]|uniref:Uncharacterized protein n=1 Tax=Capnocytophaga cynodegmi TaxID=28189 RepID=A0A0B7HIM9_9FLAO|nr:hypothetical protein CCYN2B_40190 [Capnocytophaga cynodegmi]